jgi:hypothetical protein
LKYREALFPFSPTLGVLTVALVTAGCSGSPGEDVRITLCKDMVSTRLGGSQTVAWQDARAETRGHEHAAVRLRFSAAGGDGNAACYYKYNAVEDTALTLSDPLSAYSTSPYEMTLNGKTLSRSELAQAIKQAMLKQGRELLSGSK